MSICTQSIRMGAPTLKTLYYRVQQEPLLPPQEAVALPPRPPPPTSLRTLRVNTSQALTDNDRRIDDETKMLSHPSCSHIHVLQYHHTGHLEPVLEPELNQRRAS